MSRPQHGAAVLVIGQHRDLPHDELDATGTGLAGMATRSDHSDLDRKLAAAVSGPKLSPSSHYEVLGVPPTATQDEIVDAYHRKAEFLQADIYRGLPPQVLAEGERSMMELNAAWMTLTDPERRRDYDQSRSPSEQPASELKRAMVWRPPSFGECIVCGSVPATQVTLRQEAGYILWLTRKRIDGTFCRQCGTASFRHMTNRTLIMGWWGILSFFVNVYTIFSNLRALRRLMRLGEPSWRQPEVVTAATRPISEGTPLHKRPPVYLVYAVVVWLLVGGVMATLSSGDERRPSRSTSSRLDGACLRIVAGSLEEIVDCERDHDAKVIAVETSEEACPLETDVVFTRSGEDRLLCVDEDQ